MKSVPTLVASLLIAFSLPGGAADPAAAKERIEARPLTFKRLVFKARKLIFKAHTEVRLARHRAAELADGWLEPPRGEAFRPSTPDVFEVAINSEMAGRASSESVFFDPRRDQVIERRKVRHGGKGYRKQMRFTDEGAFLLRRAPGRSGEAKLPHEQWTKIEEFFHPYSMDGSCQGLAEPAMLFHWLGAAALPAKLCVFSDETLIEVEIAVAGTERVEAAYEEVAADGTARQRDGEIEAWKVILRPAGGDGDFEFLGLSGEITVLLDPATRVPLRVEGKLSGLGRVNVKLERAELGF